MASHTALLQQGLGAQRQVAPMQFMRQHSAFNGGALPSCSGRVAAMHGAGRRARALAVRPAAHSIAESHAAPWESAPRAR